MPVRLDEAQQLWKPETLYLNTASYGLPPTPAWDQFQSVLEDWRGGRTSWEGWGDSTERARELFARMVGVPVEWVATGANTSSMVGFLAAAVPDGARVVAAEADFTSLLWPFMAQGRDIEVTCVPVAEVAEAVDERTDVVAVSAVQSRHRRGRGPRRGDRGGGLARRDARRRRHAGLRLAATRRRAASTWWPAARTNGCARRAARRS